jgi:hypothetical protein
MAREVVLVDVDNWGRWKLNSGIKQKGGKNEKA